MNPVDTNINIRQTRSDASKTNGDATRVTSDGARLSESGNAPVAGESVSITNTAADLLALENQLRELPGIDQARVDSFRQAISNGSYDVNPMRIVDSLLQSETELG